MQLRKFKIEEVLSVDCHSPEIKSWIDLCDLINFNTTTFALEPNKPSLLEIFIKTFPPEDTVINQIALINVITFGLYYFNKEEIFKLNLDNDSLVELFANERKFYKKVLATYFKEDLDQGIDEHLEHFYLRLNTAKKEMHIQVKRQYELMELKEDLDYNLDKNVSVIKKKKI